MATYQIDPLGTVDFLASTDPSEHPLRVRSDDAGVWICKAINGKWVKIHEIQSSSQLLAAQDKMLSQDQASYYEYGLPFLEGGWPSRNKAAALVLVRQIDKLVLDDVEMLMEHIRIDGIHDLDQINVGNLTTTGKVIYELMANQKETS